MNIITYMYKSAQCMFLDSMYPTLAPTPSPGNDTVATIPPDEGE